MTFRVETVFDLTTTCPDGHNSPNHPVDLDRHTWTCRTCRQSVFIDMDDQKGQAYTVERVPAREIQVGDVIVYRTHAGLEANRVTGSNPYQGKTGGWYLAVANHGKAIVPPEQSISRLPG
ncbi:hypothetical protein [Pseudomonas corrugata]|uniref:hypothetical protein n=1 Tax=Pseudomonas corrugata TaxID=47879 RepID=UPI0006D8A727|nr:hypothetical protein [Pseudomonas corrugata]